MVYHSIIQSWAFTHIKNCNPVYIYIVLWGFNPPLTAASDRAAGCRPRFDALTSAARDMQTCCLRQPRQTWPSGFDLHDRSWRECHALITILPSWSSWQFLLVSWWSPHHSLGSASNSHAYESCSLHTFWLTMSHSETSCFRAGANTNAMVAGPQRSQCAAVRCENQRSGNQQNFCGCRSKSRTAHRPQKEQISLANLRKHVHKIS